MNKVSQKLTLDRPATYQIKVPGHVDESWSDWVGGMTITVESEGEGPPLTTLSGKLDQAALLGLLRRLYALGLPLISVICDECGLYATCETAEHKQDGRAVWRMLRHTFGFAALQDVQSLTNLKMADHNFPKKENLK